MSASLARLVVGRLESYAKSQAMWHVASARRADDASRATHAAGVRAADVLNARAAWSSFACAALTAYRERCCAGVSALALSAAAAMQRASAAREEQRCWATMRRGLERRHARVHACRS
jgi:hypothetical protein